jgi:hypothetical protein
VGVGGSGYNPAGLSWIDGSFEGALANKASATSADKASATSADKASAVSAVLRAAMPSAPQNAHEERAVHERGVEHEEEAARVACE